MFKKVLAVTLAFGMIFSMGGSVMAAETEETVDTAEAAEPSESEDLVLGDYKPQKTEYNFYFTYMLFSSIKIRVSISNMNMWHR